MRRGTTYFSSTRRKCSRVSRRRRSPGTIVATTTGGATSPGLGIAAALVLRDARWQRRDDVRRDLVRDRPHRVDLIPVVVLVVDPRAEHTDVVAHRQSRKVLPRHDL